MAGEVIAVLLLIGVAALAVYASPVGASDETDEDYEPGGIHGTPLTPTNRRIVEHDSRLELKWWKDGYCDGFDLQYRAEGATDWIDSGYCANWWAWDLALLDNDTTYEVRVRNRLNGHVSEWLTGSGTPRAAVIPQPTGNRDVPLSSTVNAHRIGHCRAAQIFQITLSAAGQ